MRLKGIFLILIGAFALIYCGKESSSPMKVDLKNGWKFMNRDSLIFARADYDDSGWMSIGVDKTWNKQGFPKYEGFAWYRCRVRIPSSLKRGAALSDSIVFHLGKIDDFDQVFLNGQLIAENLKTVAPGTPANNTYKDLNYSFWDVERRYALAVDDPRIKWDAQNVIAVRVYDWGVAGGIYSGDLYIAMPDISEYVQINFDRGRFKKEGETLTKSVTLKNTAGGYSAGGTLKVDVVNNMNGAAILNKKYTVTLAPRAEKSFTFNFPRPVQSTTITYNVRFDQSIQKVQENEGVPYILTPPEKLQPQINGARIYGQRPGKPFLFRIPATGKRPLSFAAQGLPPGLKLDTSTGIISGKVKQKGTYDVTLTARNALGQDQKKLRIVIGDNIALTPPMGWNSWNVWGLSVDQNKVFAAGKAFVDKGLADHGWTYINIDDGWEIFGKSGEPKRTSAGEIRTNKKFPDLKKLGDDIHALGLKFGIYSSPGPLTCGGYTASYGHEAQDARTFAKWGIDYLKYDLCSYRKLMKDQNDPKELIPPYQKMHNALQKVNRDIIYSLCEYGNGKVWQWGAKVGGNLWRTTGDIWDDWQRMYQIGFGQSEAAKYAGPGHWNDPDMLVVGWVGWGENLHYTNLTPDEQYTHVSLWALLSAPLLIGCDLQRLDDFTLNLLTNDEVLAVDQDVLGKQAVPVLKSDDIQVYSKELADGAKAIGIFNTGQSAKKYELDLKGAVTIRDLWRQKDLGRFTQRFETVVPAHGVTLVKLSKE